MHYTTWESLTKGHNSNIELTVTKTIEEVKHAIKWLLVLTVPWNIWTDILQIN